MSVHETTVAVGGGGGATVTVVGAFVEPPSFVQVSVKVVVAVSGPVRNEPAIGWFPTQAGVPPEPVHEMAPVADQVIVLESAYATELGAAEMVTAGTGGRQVAMRSGSS